MNQEIKYNTLTWIILLILILATYLIPSFFQHTLFWTCALSSLKFTGVLFQFVEVKKAHILWKIIGIFFVVCYLLLFSFS